MQPSGQTRRSATIMTTNRVLRDVLGAVPALGRSSLQHALGRQLFRAGRYADATVWLRQAAEGDTDDARFAFVYGVALHDTGKTPRGCGSSKRPPAVIPATPRPGDGRLRSTRRAVRRFAE